MKRKKTQFESVKKTKKKKTNDEKERVKECVLGGVNKKNHFLPSYQEIIHFFIDSKNKNQKKKE
jgi:hypothetical protein